MTSRQAINDAVKEAYDAGLCVIPPREDGSKAPAAWWEEYQRERPSLDLLRKYYREERYGLGTLGGPVSGNLEVFELESEKIWTQFRCAMGDAGHDDLLEKVEAGYLERAPRGGVHYLWQSIAVGRSHKVAMSLENAEFETLIETKADGGYCILAPSYGPVHKSGRPYVRLSGSFATIPYLEPEERETFFRIGTTFDCRPKAEEVPYRPDSDAGDLSKPGNDFNRRGDWHNDVLLPLGWKLVSDRPDREGRPQEYWRRPGKDVGNSAVLHPTLGNGGLFVCFSTSTPIPETETGYSKWRTYAWLHHGGDFAAAAGELRRRGYGQVHEPVLWTPPEGIVPLRSLADLSIPEITSLPLLGRDQLAIDGGSHLIYGKPKAGKTELLLRLMDDWQEAGLRTLILTEEPLMFWKKRLQQLGRPFESWDGAIGDATGWGISRALNALEKIEGFDVLVVDTLRNTVGYREGKADEDVPRVVIPLILAAREKGQTLFASYHARKMPGDFGDDVSGHHSLLAAFDRAIQLRLVSGEGHEQKRRLHVYGRLMDPTGTTGLTYEWMPDGSFKVLDAETVLTKEKVCQTCGKVFPARRSTARFCSDACRFQQHTNGHKSTESGNAKDYPLGMELSVATTRENGEERT